MKILQTEQIRDADKYTIENEPISSIDLMERAATQSADWICANFTKESRFFIFAGPGNNGGDGLVIARLLAQRSFSAEVFILDISGKFSDDFSTNLKRLKKQNKVTVSFINDTTGLTSGFFQSTINNQQSSIIIDALFGSGLTRPLSGFAAKVVDFINRSGLKIISIDIPSGLFGEGNSTNNYSHIIKACHTLAFQFPKLAFLFAENEEYVGDWTVLPIGLHTQFIDSAVTPYYYVTKPMVSAMLRNRKKFSHKGNYGHALLVAGSYGKMGACVLAARACLRTGAGLLTAHIPQSGNIIMQVSVPEAMVSMDASDKLFSEVPQVENYSAIGVGPGIGIDAHTEKAVENLLEATKSPMVIDADALNIIARHKSLLKKIPANSILTPHPKEFERLAGKHTDSYTRNLALLEFAKKHRIYVILKGRNSAIACPDGTCYFNSTGNPGMATAGSGDVLTGIILSLLSQGYDSREAAIVSTFLHGLAGDIAASKSGEEALIAGDIVENLGMAFLDFHNNKFAINYTNLHGLDTVLAVKKQI